MPLFANSCARVTSKNSNMKGIVLGLFILAAIAATSYGVYQWRIETKERNTSKEEESQAGEMEKAADNLECPNKKETVQLIDSEKCIWECSSFYVAPTETRCTACKGIVVPQHCVMCPPLCEPSVSVIMELGRRKFKKRN
ncbi:MAG: hypothetical protein JWQ35_2075 [Bacteriovoracaceae bacterium]|nr:hypothetical protein [Bacteriovoracaceae bacterium]